MPIRAPRGALSLLGRRATASSFENSETARGVVVGAAATITPFANGSRERGRGGAVTYATETHAMMNSCLCKDVLAAAAKRCKSAPRDGNHFATFGLAIVGDILDATRSRHTAKFGASHWIDRNALVSDAVKQMAATDLGALICMDVTSLDADRSLSSGPMSSMKERCCSNVLATGLPPAVPVRESQCRAERDRNQVQVLY